MQWMFKNMFIVIDSFLKCLMELVGLKKTKKKLESKFMPWCCYKFLLLYYNKSILKSLWVLMSVYIYSTVYTRV